MNEPKHILLAQPLKEFIYFFTVVNFCQLADLMAFVAILIIRPSTMNVVSLNLNLNHRNDFEIGSKISGGNQVVFAHVCMITPFPITLSLSKHVQHFILFVDFYVKFKKMEEKTCEKRCTFLSYNCSILIASNHFRDKLLNHIHCTFIWYVLFVFFTDFQLNIEICKCKKNVKKMYVF